MRSVTRSTSTIVFRSTPQRSLAALLSSSHLCPVSTTQTDLYATALPHDWTLTPEHRVSDSSSLSSTHNLWPLPDIQLDNWLRLVQHNSTVGWDFERRILRWKRSEPRSPYFVLAEFQVLWRYWPAQTRVVRLQLSRRGETHLTFTQRKWAAVLASSESFMWACAQAKGSCEDYNPVSPEGSMSSFNNTSPGPTPSTTMADGQPVTRGMFLCSRNLQENRYVGITAASKGD